MTVVNHITLTKAKVADVLNALERSGKFFTVHFIKQDGSFRTMNAKFLPDDTRKRYIGNGEHHTCLTVMDLVKKEYRQIPLDRVELIKANGNVYQVV